MSEKAWIAIIIIVALLFAAGDGDDRDECNANPRYAVIETDDGWVCGVRHLDKN